MIAELLLLPAHQVHRLAGPVTLRSRRGHLWVTQDGHTEDHVLAPGEYAHFPRGAGLLVMALGADAQVRILREASGPGAPIAKGAPRPVPAPARELPGGAPPWAHRWGRGLALRLATWWGRGTGVHNPAGTMPAWQRPTS